MSNYGVDIIKNKSNRATIQIPKGSKIYNYLFENKKSQDVKWKVLDEIIENLPKTKGEQAILILDEFIEKISTLYPEKKSQLGLLRPLIIKKIINNSVLEDWYYDELKKKL